jgi:hypothetical protein
MSKPLIKDYTAEAITIITMFSLLFGFCFLSQGVSILSSDTGQGLVEIALGILNVGMVIGLSSVSKWYWTLRVMIPIELILVVMLSFLSENLEHMIVAIVFLIVYPSILFYVFNSQVKSFLQKITGLEYFRYYLSRT